MSVKVAPGIQSLNKKNETIDDFEYIVEQFADVRILRYQVTGFESLSLQQKILVYYLSQAALCGRDIIFDQNGKYNLLIRKILEAIVSSYTGDRSTRNFNDFITYIKRIWFANGIYHHYSNDKFKPGFEEEFFRHLVMHSDKKLLPLNENKPADELLDKIVTVIFDPDVFPRKVSNDPTRDLVQHSAVNFYENITEKESIDYYEKQRAKNAPEPVSLGLNSRLCKEEGKICEKTWKIGGLYGEVLERIVYWLGKAQEIAENDQQKKTIHKLIEFYQTGDLKTFDEYNILWLKDTLSRVDFVNGFIETYEDPLGIKGTWESVVNFRDEDATRRTRIISENAQWFEDHSPVDDRFKKKIVRGVSAKVITVAQLGGDCYPATPIGINLPNADWIRKEHGSKSVTLENVTYAYEQASLNTGFLEEFCSSPEEVSLMKAYSYISGNIHTDLHECLGHGSGQLMPGVSAEALKNYHAPLEEARADLFALYYLMDPKILELGLLPCPEAAIIGYSSYIRNGLFTQLTRIDPGKEIEQAHMRCRQLISGWCFEKGKMENVIERFVCDGKTFFRINDYSSLRNMFGQLLGEIQRIKSEGDYEAGKTLVETHGVKVDKSLHNEVLERYSKLKLAPYSGFINPVFNLVEENGEISEVIVTYPKDYLGQMMDYSKKYSFLPVIN